MIIATFPKSSYVETLLNNLSEADFNLADVSVIMRDQKLRNTIAQDVGPLKGTTFADLPGKLAQVGLSKPDAQSFTDAVAKGQALVVMNAPKGSEQAAAEMMKDQSATLVKVVP